MERSVFYRNVWLTVGLSLSVFGAFADTLTWNGGNAGTWDATTANWTTAGGEATAWVEGSSIVVPAGQVVNATTTFTVAGATLGSGATIGGEGSLLLSGDVSVAAGGASLALPVWTGNACSKTGAGDLAVGQLAGSMTVSGGRLLTGGYHGARGSAVENGGTHAVMAADAAATDLIANGSFEDSATAMPANGYIYVKGSQMPTSWDNPSSDYFVRINGTGGNAWNKSTTILDGSYMVGFQRAGTASQTVTVPADGFYELTYKTCKRSSSDSMLNHALEVTVDGVRRFAQMSVWLLSSPANMGTGPIWLSAGTHVIGFKGEERWGDATTFIDNVQLRACAAASASALANEVVVADGTATAPTFAPANGLSYLTKTGEGTCTISDAVTVPGNYLHISTAGRLEFAGKVTGGGSTPILIKRGPGTVSYTGGLEALGLQLTEGTVELTSASNFGLMIRTRAGAPATFVMDTTENRATADTSVLGTGAATIRTTGGVHTFTLATNGNTIPLSVPEFAIDVGTGDLVQLPYLYQPAMNGKSYVTDLVKAGPGRLQMQAGTPTNVGGTGLAGQTIVRDGTLELKVDDLTANTSHPLTGAAHLYCPLLGAMNRPLQVGDAATPAEAALVVKPLTANFASTRTVNVGAQGASVAFDASELDGSALFGDIVLGRAETAAKGPSTGTLMLGALSRADGVLETVNLTATGSVLIDACADAGVSVASTGTLGFGRTAVSAVTLNALDLSGVYGLGFVNGESPVVHAGTLRLGSTSIRLVDRVSGETAVVIGTRTLFTYDTLEGDPDQLLTMEAASCVSGYSYSFEHDATAKTISLTVRAAADSPDYTWMSSSDGSWDTGSCWDHGTAPDAANVFAVFGAVPTTATTVTLDGTKTVGGLTFANTQGYTLTGGTLLLAPQDGARPVIRASYGTHVIASALGTTDGGALTVEMVTDAKVILDGPVNAPVNVTSGTVGFGSHAQVNAPVTTAEGVTTSVDGDMTVNGAATLAGPLTGSGRITKTGSGDLTLPTLANGSRPFAGTLAVEQGTLKLGAPAMASATVEIGAEGALAVDPAAHGLMGTFRTTGAKDWSGIQPFCEKVFSLNNFQQTFNASALITQDFFDASKSSVFHVLDSDKESPTLPLVCRENTGSSSANYWMAAWEGVLTAPESGVYEFSCKPDDAMLLAIDRRNVMQSTNCTAVAGSVYLEKGPHSIYIGLVEISGNSGLALNVKRPGSSTVEGLPIAWLSPSVAAKRTIGAGALAPADGTVLTVRQGAGVNTAFTGTMAGEGTGALVLEPQPDTANGLFEVSDWTGGYPYLRKGELALAAPNRTVEAIGSDYNTGTLNLIGAAGVKSLSGNSITSLGAHLWARSISTDDNCGISADKTYTHLVAFPLTGRTNPLPVVNGVTFDGHGSFDGAGPGSIRNDASGFTGFKSLFNSFTYGLKSYAFTLKGLTPGKVYDFRFYWMTYGVSKNTSGGANGKRNGTFTFSGQDADGNACQYQTYTADLESAWGSTPKGSFAIIGCRYVAGPDGKMTVNISSETANDTVHCYAFSNELMSPNASAGDRVTIAPTTGTRATLNAELNGTADVTVAGEGEQRLAGAVKLTKPMTLTGHLTLANGADVRSGVTLADGTLEMRGGSKVWNLSGTGTLDFKWGDPRPFGDLRDDGTYAAVPNLRVVNFTGDNDCGITPSKTYLLALNYKASASQTTFDYVNEIPFKQASPAKQTPTASEMYDYVDTRARVGAFLVGVPWTTHAGGNGAKIGLASTEGLYNILYAMAYASGQANKAMPIKIGGLTVGKTYELRFWERMWSEDSIPKRNVRFSFLPEGSTTEEVHDVAIDGAGQTSPYYIAIRFKATSGSYTVTSTSLAGDTWHLYGATVEEFSYGPDRAVVEQATDMTFSGTVTGVGMVEKRGAGTLTLAGADVDAKGFWFVSGGGLRLADAAATLGEVAVDSNCSFGGTGRVTGNLGVAANGTLVLDGNLQVGGKLALGAGAKVVVTGKSTCSAETLVLPADLKITPTAKLSGRTTLFSGTGSLEELGTAGWTVYKTDGETVDRTAKITLADDKKSILLVPASGTTIFIR